MSRGNSLPHLQISEPADPVVDACNTGPHQKEILQLCDAIVSTVYSSNIEPKEKKKKEDPNKHIGLKENHCHGKSDRKINEFTLNKVKTVKLSTLNGEALEDISTSENSFDMAIECLDELVQVIDGAIKDISSLDIVK